MSGRPSYMLMLQIEHGEKVPLPFKYENLSGDRIVAIIDEYNDTLYLWFGKDCSIVRKRSALRTAQSIKKSGFAYGQLHIGHDLKELKIVDESTMDDPETQSNHKELTAIFNRKFTMKDQFLMEVGPKPQAAPAVQPAEQEAYTPPEPTPQPAPTEPVSAPEPAPVAEAVPEPAVSPEPVGRAEPVSAIDPELAGQVKLGLLAVILATKFSGFQVKSVLSSDGKPTYEFSSAGGVLCKVSLDGRDLVILPESEFGGMRNEIIDLLKKKVSELNL
nr:hypothetical protein [Candidatus Sigynarchaeota archaeon]